MIFEIIEGGKKEVPTPEFNWIEQAQFLTVVTREDGSRLVLIITPSMQGEDYKAFALEAEGSVLQPEHKLVGVYRHLHVAVMASETYAKAWLENTEPRA